MAEEVSSPEDAQAPEMTPQKPKPTVCNDFILDVQATTFNICKRCGAPKVAHKNFSRATDELKGKLGKRDIINATKASPGAEVATAACGNFRRDLSGATFDMCLCGFPKSAHVVKALTHGAGTELTKKLTKGKSDECTSIEVDRTTEPPCQCAGCVIV